MAIGVSSAPYAKFVNDGDRHGGEIVDFRVVQNIDPKVRRPLYLQEINGKWERSFSPYGPDGKPNDPIVQWEITVETGVPDENDDTERRIFVDPRKGRRGSTTFGKRGGDAVANALKKAKAHRVGLEIGGTFYLIFEGKVDDGDNKVNTWSGEYTPPPGGPGSGKPLDEVPHLVGGQRYDKVAELEKWEREKGMPALRESVANAQAAHSSPATAVNEDKPVSWPNLNQPAPASTAAAAPAYDDDEPPF